MSKTHTIITIGRQFGSGGREIGNVWQMNWELSFMIKNCCHGQQRTVRYAKSFLRHMMKNRRTVFSIHW